METTCGGSGMNNFECPSCEHHKNRAARWRAEAYKQAGHDKIELPWVGLTDEEINSVRYNRDWTAPWTDTTFARAIEEKLKEKNT